MNAITANTVGVCDTQPVILEGIRALLSSCPDLQLVAAATSLVDGMEIVQTHAPAVLLIDKSFGLQPVIDWIGNLRAAEPRTAPVIWGISIHEAEALRLMQAGAQGVIRKTADLTALLACLRAVAGGSPWMEEALFLESERMPRRRSNLTAREHQIVELVEQGLKNKEIARSLGIRPGTVKIHLRHIFEKTGVRGRYGLALNGLKEKGLLSIPAA